MVYDVGYLANGALGTMAMVNYPYPTSFIEPMPAWPVHAACDAALSEPRTTQAEKLAALQRASAIYYNYTGETGECLDLYAEDTSGLDTDGWSK